MFTKIHLKYWGKKTEDELLTTKTLIGRVPIIHCMANSGVVEWLNLNTYDVNETQHHDINNSRLFFMYTN